MPYSIETVDQKSVRLRGRGGGEWTANDTLKGLMRFLPKKGLTTYRQAEKKGINTRIDKASESLVMLFAECL